MTRCWMMEVVEVGEIREGSDVTLQSAGSPRVAD